MKSSFKVLLLLSVLIVSSSYALARSKARILNTEISIDANNRDINNVFAQGTATDITFNGASATTTDLIKRVIGDVSDDNGDVYLVEIVGDANLRYLANNNGDTAVTTTTGSRLPSGAGKQLRIKAGDVFSAIGETGNGTLNVTRMQ